MLPKCLNIPLLQVQCASIDLQEPEPDPMDREDREDREERQDREDTPQSPLAYFAV